MLSEIGLTADTCTNAIKKAMAILGDPNASQADMAQARHDIEIASQVLATLANLLDRTPYVPTPQEVVDMMLQLAKIQPGDILYDLGSGDGRIVITAAKRFGIRCVGIEDNASRIEEATTNAQNAGVADKVTFRRNDIFAEDIGEATVVAIYLLPAVNRKLRAKLLAELKPGTRIVSHDFDIGDWKPEQCVPVGKTRALAWVVPESGT